MTKEARTVRVPADLWEQVAQLIEGLPAAALGNAPVGQVATFVDRVRSVETGGAEADG